MGIDPISIGLGAISGLTSLSGLLGGNAAQARAQAARQQAITDMSKQLDEEYQNLVQRNQHSLNAATGQGGDAIRALGSNLGAGLAQAGVYNSSATAGALTQATANQGAQLSSLASTNQYNQQSLLGQNQRYLTGLKYNLANDQLSQANSDLSGSRQGLSSFLGSLAQYNLSRSGQNQLQNSLPRSQGGYGNDSVLSLGGGPLTQSSAQGYQGQQQYNMSLFSPSGANPFSY